MTVVCCPVKNCERIFSDQKLSLDHVRQDHKSRAAVCPFENCSRVYQSFMPKKTAGFVNELGRHLRNVHDYKIFPCERYKCIGQWFSTEADFQKHEETHRDCPSPVHITATRKYHCGYLPDEMPLRRARSDCYKTVRRDRVSRAELESIVATARQTISSGPKPSTSSDAGPIGPRRRSSRSSSSSQLHSKSSFVAASISTSLSCPINGCGAGKFANACTLQLHLKDLHSDKVWCSCPSKDCWETFLRAADFIDHMWLVHDQHAWVCECTKGCWFDSKDELVGHYRQQHRISGFDEKLTRSNKISCAMEAPWNWSPVTVKLAPLTDGHGSSTNAKIDPLPKMFFGGAVDMGLESSMGEEEDETEADPDMLSDAESVELGFRVSPRKPRSKSKSPDKPIVPIRRVRTFSPSAGSDQLGFRKSPRRSRSKSKSSTVKPSVQLRRVRSISPVPAPVESRLVPKRRSSQKFLASLQATRDKDSHRIHSCKFPDCRRNFLSPTALAAHMKEDHKSMVMVCPVKDCDRIYVRKCEFLKHLESRHRKMAFFCNKCEGMVFMMTKALWFKHNEEVHGAGKSVSSETEVWDLLTAPIQKIKQAEVKIAKLTDPDKQLATRPSLKPTASPTPSTPQQRQICTVGRCGEEFHTAKQLLEHVKLSHSDEVILCSEEDCSRYFARKASQVKHLRDSHGYEPFYCLICSATVVLKNEAAFEDHQKEHKLMENSSHFSVSSSDDEEEITASKKDAEKEQRRRAANFGKVAITRNNRRHDARIYSCNLVGCQQKFPTQSDLMVHVKEVHADKVVFCPEDDCGLYFHEKVAFKTHMQSRHAQKIFICDTCGVTQWFRDGPKFIEHFKRHSVENEDAKKTPTESLWSCPVDGCDRKFQLVSALDAHLRDRHKELAIVCTYGKCKRTFVQEELFCVHMKEVHKADIFFCDQCAGKRSYYFTQNGLNAHVKSQHKTSEVYACFRVEDIDRFIPEVGQHFAREKMVSRLHLEEARAFFATVHYDRTCLECCGVMPDDATLRRHRREKFGSARPTNFVCFICVREFSSLTEFKGHFHSAAHGRNLHNAVNGFAPRPQLKNRVLNADGDSDVASPEPASSTLYECAFEDCAFVCATDDGILAHMKDVHGPLVASCGVCRRYFLNARGFEYHMTWSHNKEVNGCYQCGAGRWFFLKSSLADHRKTDTANRELNEVVASVHDQVDCAGLREDLEAVPEDPFVIVDMSGVNSDVGRMDDMLSAAARKLSSQLANFANNTGRVKDSLFVAKPVASVKSVETSSGTLAVKDSLSPDKAVASSSSGEVLHIPPRSARKPFVSRSSYAIADCPIRNCAEKFDSSTTLKLHVKLVHSFNILTCTKCEVDKVGTFWFLEQSGFAEHSLSHPVPAKQRVAFIKAQKLDRAERNYVDDDDEEEDEEDGVHIADEPANTCGANEVDAPILNKPKLNISMTIGNLEGGREVSPSPRGGGEQVNDQLVDDFVDKDNDVDDVPNKDKDESALVEPEIDESNKPKRRSLRSFSKSPARSQSTTEATNDDTGSPTTTDNLDSQVLLSSPAGESLEDDTLVLKTVEDVQQDASSNATPDPKHISKPFSCPRDDCDFCDSSIDGILPHFQTAHPGDAIQRCPTLSCVKYFISAPALYEHVQTDHRRWLYYCASCWAGKKDIVWFWGIHDLKKHDSESHGGSASPKIVDSEDDPDSTIPIAKKARTFDKRSSAIDKSIEDVSQEKDDDSGKCPLPKKVKKKVASSKIKTASLGRDDKDNASEVTNGAKLLVKFRKRAKPEDASANLDDSANLRKGKRTRVPVRKDWSRGASSAASTPRDRPRSSTPTSKQPAKKPSSRPSTPASNSKLLRQVMDKPALISLEKIDLSTVVDCGASVRSSSNDSSSVDENNDTSKGSRICENCCGVFRSVEEMENHAVDCDIEATTTKGGADDTVIVKPVAFMCKMCLGTFLSATKLVDHLLAKHKEGLERTRALAGYAESSLVLGPDFWDPFGAAIGLTRTDSPTGQQHIAGTGKSIDGENNYSPTTMSNKSVSNRSPTNNKSGKVMSKRIDIANSLENEELDIATAGSDNDPFTATCPVPNCGSEFDYYNDLAIHVETVHEGVAYACPLEACRRSFTVFAEFESHMLGFHCTSLYHCGFCTEWFLKSRDWKVHQNQCDPLKGMVGKQAVNLGDTATRKIKSNVTIIVDDKDDAHERLGKGKLVIDSTDRDLGAASEQLGSGDKSLIRKRTLSAVLAKRKRIKLAGPSRKISKINNSAGDNADDDEEDLVVDGVNDDEFIMEWSHVDRNENPDDSDFELDEGEQSNRGKMTDGKKTSRRSRSAAGNTRSKTTRTKSAQSIRGRKSLGASKQGRNMSATPPPAPPTNNRNPQGLILTTKDTNFNRRRRARFFNCKVVECQQNFQTHIQMLNHIRADHAQDPGLEVLLCPYSECQQVFRHATCRTLTDHLSRNHNEPTHGCPDCRRWFWLKEEKRRHMIRSHGTGTIDETVADLDFSGIPDIPEPAIVPLSEASGISCFALEIMTNVDHWVACPLAPVCAEHFATRLTQCVHVREAHPEITVSCPEPGCGFVFSALQVYRYHMLTFHRRKVFVCENDDCSLVKNGNCCFEDEREFQEHLDTVHDGLKTVRPAPPDPAPKQRYGFSSCPFGRCKKTFDNNEQLMAHCDEFHQRPVFNCPYEDCRRVVVTKQGVYLHMLKVHEIHVRVCSYCLGVFDSPAKLNQHYRIYHPAVRSDRIMEILLDSWHDPPPTTNPTAEDFNSGGGLEYSCELCDGVEMLMFENKKDMETHQLQEHLNVLSGDFRCEFCPEAFSSESVRLEHYGVAHDRPWVEGGDGYICQKCERRFVLKRSMKNHIFHAHPISLPLPICNVAGCSQFFLTLFHRNQHYLEKHPDICAICPHDQRRFLGRRTFESHMLKFHNQYAVTCTACGVHVWFWSKAKLAEHVQEQHADTRIICPEEGCFQVWARKSHTRLREHMSEVHGKSLCYCFRCRIDFGSKEEILEHYRNAHPEIKLASESKNAVTPESRKRLHGASFPSSSPSLAVLENTLMEEHGVGEILGDPEKDPIPKVMKGGRRFRWRYNRPLPEDDDDEQAQVLDVPRSRAAKKRRHSAAADKPEDKSPPRATKLSPAAKRRGEQSIVSYHSYADAEALRREQAVAQDMVLYAQGVTPSVGAGSGNGDAYARQDVHGGGGIENLQFAPNTVTTGKGLYSNMIDDFQGSEEEDEDDYEGGRAGGEQIDEFDLNEDGPRYPPESSQGFLASRNISNNLVSGQNVSTSGPQLGVDGLGGSGLNVMSEAGQAIINAQQQPSTSTDPTNMFVTTSDNMFDFVVNTEV